jgi:glycerol uptake facilitator protein
MSLSSLRPIASYEPNGGGARSGGELLAGFLGTLVLIAFGDGVVAMAVAALNQSGRGEQIFAASGDWLLITGGGRWRSPSACMSPAASAAPT